MWLLQKTRYLGGVMVYGERRGEEKVTPKRYLYAVDSKQGL
jgi:hypothetical protein